MFFNIIIIFIIIIILFIILFLLNNNLNKNMNKHNSYEYFERIGNPLFGSIPDEEYYGCQINCVRENKNLLCGTNGNQCAIDEENISTCCNGYSCKRQPGNFNHKICIKDGLNNLDNSQFGLGLLKYNSGLRANIDYPNVKYSPNSLPKFNIDPNINIGFLNDNFLKSHVFSSSVCPVK